MGINTQGEDLPKTASTLSNRIDLQGSDIDRSTYGANCVRCPANDGIAFNVNNMRHQLYCALQASLLLGDPYEATQISSQVEAVLGTDNNCPPIQGGRRIREFLLSIKDEEY